MVKTNLSDGAKKVIKARAAGATLRYDREYGRFTLHFPDGKVEEASVFAVRELVNAGRLLPSVFSGRID